MSGEAAACHERRPHREAAEEKRHRAKRRLATAESEREELHEARPRHGRQRDGEPELMEPPNPSRESDPGLVVGEAPGAELAQASRYAPQRETGAGREPDAPCLQGGRFLAQAPGERCPASAREPHRLASSRTRPAPCRASSLVRSAFSRHVSPAARGPPVKKSRTVRPKVKNPSRIACPPVRADSSTTPPAFSPASPALTGTAANAKAAANATPTPRCFMTVSFLLFQSKTCAVLTPKSRPHGAMSRPRGGWPV